MCSEQLKEKYFTNQTKGIVVRDDIKVMFVTFIVVPCYAIRIGNLESESRIGIQSRESRNRIYTVVLERIMFAAVTARFPYEAIRD